METRGNEVPGVKQPTERVGIPMNVTYTDKAKQGGEGFALLQQATRHLEEVLGPSVETVKAEWDRTEDGNGRSRYTLRLSDWSGSVSASFTPAELQSLSRRRIPLYRLWDDLLQVRNHKQLEELQKADRPEN
jgi:hypothetical protein